MNRIALLIAVISFFIAAPAKGIDIAPLWDYSQPAVSEERFRTALKTTDGDDALILQTQIARTYVLRKDFSRARKLLDEVQPKIDQAGPEAQTRYWLELGRTYASHQHPAEAQTTETKRLARDAYSRALQIAKRARLDALAIDVIHMFAFVDTAPADQLRWGQEALAMVESSDQDQAKRWEPSVRNNMGEALYELGRYDEALEQFERALTLIEHDTNKRRLRDAHWQVARTLRALGRTDDALAIQLRLESESDAASDPKSYVFEELEILYRAKGDTERAQYYADRIKSIAE